MGEAKWNEPFENRRRAPRARATGSAVVHLHAHALSARVVDVSTRGIRLHVGAGLAHPELADAHVVVELRLDGVRNHWLRCTGTIGRVDEAGDQLVIELISTPTDFEDLIQDELVASVEGDRVTYVLLVDSVSHRRKALARAFRAAGCRVAEAGTTLEAMSALDDSQSHFSLIAIADTTPAFVAEEFRRFVAEVHPELTSLITHEPLPLRAYAAAQPDHRGETNT